MAEHLFVTTDEEEAAITASRLATAPELPDNDTFINTVVRANVLTPAVKLYIEAQVTRVADAYRAATPEERAAAEAALRVSLQ